MFLEINKDYLNVYTIVKILYNGVVWFQQLFQSIYQLKKKVFNSKNFINA